MFSIVAKLFWFSFGHSPKKMAFRCRGVLWLAALCLCGLVPGGYGEITLVTGGKVTDDDHVASGGSLLPGQRLWSSNGQAYLEMLEDGNAVTFRKCEPFSDRAGVWSSPNNIQGYVWASFTSRIDFMYDDVIDVPKSIKMQEDGNLAMYNSKGKLLWSSKTAGPKFAGAVFKVNDDGTLCVAKDGCLWKSGGTSQCAPTPSPDFANAKVILKPGDSFGTQDYWSNNKTCKLALEDQPVKLDRRTMMDPGFVDYLGALVITRQCDGQEVYSIRDSEVHVNVVPYLKRRLQLQDTPWLSDMNGVGGDLRMGSDCQLCIFKDGSCRWTSPVISNPCPSTKDTEANQV